MISLSTYRRRQRDQQTVERPELDVRLRADDSRLGARSGGSAGAPKIGSFVVFSSCLSL